MLKHWRNWILAILRFISRRHRQSILSTPGTAPHLAERKLAGESTVKWVLHINHYKTTPIWSNSAKQHANYNTGRCYQNSFESRRPPYTWYATFYFVGSWCHCWIISWPAGLGYQFHVPPAMWLLGFWAHAGHKGNKQNRHSAPSNQLHLDSPDNQVRVQSQGNSIKCFPQTHKPKPPLNHTHKCINSPSSLTLKWMTVSLPCTLPSQFKARLGQNV